MIDPVRARRARIAKLVDVGQRAGYSLFGVAVLLFVAGYVAGYSDLLTGIIATCLVAGSLVLAPAIVFGYAVKAAEREDRQRGE